MTETVITQDVSATRVAVADTFKEPYISVVIPLYNEEDSIPQLYDVLTTALEEYGKPFEVIVVDDGSRDGSYPLLRELAAEDPRLKVVRLRRNFGQTAAFSAGFDLARGEVVVTMDADLQNDPRDIPKLMEKIDAGYDIVSGWRKDRKDRFLDRKLPSMIANRLISNVTDVQLHDYGCSLKAYRTDIIKDVQLYGELHRFIPALASQVGGAVTEVPVRHHERQYGQSKYGISRTIRVILDLITVWFLGGYSTRPLHVFGTLGLLTAGAGILTGSYLTLLKFLGHQDIGGRPLLLLAVLLVVVGVQLITMGLLGEINIRTYYESQNKPIYIVRDILNGEEDPDA